MQTLIEKWDGLAVVARFDRPTGTWIFIALHDNTMGPMSGGTRMRVYPRPEDALLDAMRLAEGMTYKWAAIDFPIGGGKAVLAVPRPLAGEERRELLRRYARILDGLRGAFSTGVDLGTTPDDMGVIREVTPYVHGFDRDGTRLDPGPFTARGVYMGVRAALRHVLGSDDPRGRRVLVQGVGDVGLPLARLLREAGAELLLADLDRTRLERVARELGGGTVAPEAVASTPCDVYAPCAIGAVLNRDTIPALACRIVAGSANNQLQDPGDAEALHRRGILYAPDYIINGGGAMAFGLLSQGVYDKLLLFRRVEGIGPSLSEVFREAAECGESPVRTVERRIKAILARGPLPQPVAV